MKDTWLTWGHTEYSYWENWNMRVNTPWIEVSWYSTPDKEIVFPWLTLQEYKEKGLLQKGCDNLKKQRRQLNIERLEFLFYSY